MRNITVNLDYDFWDMYPEFKNIEEFKYIKKEYKTKSSLVMYFIVSCFDLDSKFINLPLDERTTLLSKDYLNDKDWYKNNGSKIQFAVARWEDMADTTASRQLRQLLETMEKRTKFLREAEYDLENFDKLDKMAANTAALFKVFETIEKQLNKEKGVGATKGGHELSLLDSDDI